MKISICVPQYNRINFLLKSLAIIEKQSYNEIEIIISDDCSTDNTIEEITNLSKTFRYPIILSKNEYNRGFDYNYRRSIELSTGDYSLVIGNDDSLNGINSIQILVDFLKANDTPEIGFCNCVDERDGNSLLKRAHKTEVIGSGANIALKYYSCFSFVGGLIYKKSAFDRFNTSKHDGSVYAQMYLGCLMIASGCRIFSIEEPLVIKDILVNNTFRNSYRDRIAKKWKDYKVVDGGLPSVINVLVSSFRDAKVLDQEIVFRIFKRIYLITLPFWIQDYKSNNALPAAVGIIQGLIPISNKNYTLLSTINRIKIWAVYIAGSSASLILPNFIFRRFQTKLYQFFKR